MISKKIKELFDNQTAEPSNGLYLLEIPTGGGKTYSAFEAIVVRQMYSNGGKSVDDGFVRKLFDLMKVRFVRYNNYTVLPFPAKYLREARNILEN